MQKNKSRLSDGDVVENSEKTSSIGVLVKKCDLHEDYWTVYREGKLEVWWEPNIVALSSERRSE